MKKKILSAVLALCLAFGSAAALPQSAVVESTSITTSAEASTATSGKCGENVSWSLKNGVLTISGKGKMTDYYYNDVTNPFRERTDIKSVIIKSGVTSIGGNAFYNCSSLTSVTIPSSVTSIGEKAFSECTSLKSVTIPSSVKSIGEAAFFRCTSLTSVTIPNSVTSIGDNAFKECSSLTSVTIPKSVTSIGGEAFKGTKWLENKQKQNPLVIVNGILIDGYKCSGTVTIPKSVKSIGGEAFYGCSLTSVTIPSSVKSIGDSAFSFCTSLKSVTIQNGVKSIGDGAFSCCTSLKSVTIQNGVKSIGDSAFYECTNLTSVTIPNSVTSIGSTAFYGCTSLKSVTIPSSVTSIGGLAFSGTKWLENKQKQNPLVVVNGILIDGTKCSGKVTIPSSVTSIGAFAFDGCTSLKSVTIPNSIKSIGDYAFWGCENLTSITIPNSVTSIGSGAFQGCKGITKITIPNSVTSIGDCAFYGCTSLKSITIPSNVKSIGEAAFGYKAYEIPNAVKKVTGFTIYGAKGSAAEKYAKKNGFKFVALNVTEPKVVRYAGSDRAETATKISKAVNAKTSDTVILATGFDFHDALAAVPLASAYNAPLLLADRDNLSAKTLAEIKRLKAKNIIVVASTNAKDNNGNDAAIRNNVYKQLKGYKVTKITGSSYYETAKKVAVQLKAVTKKNPTSVFVTTDKNYADALSASPVAAILGAPILYVDPKASLNSTTKNYLASIKKNVKNVYIVGGVNAVSKNVEKSVLSVLGKKSATRFAGDNRYDTCVLINKSFAKYLTGKSVCIAKGYNFPDALAGGVFAAKNKAPLFLADKLDAKATISKTQANYLYIKNPSKLYIFGGETAVPTALVKTIAKACV